MRGKAKWLWTAGLVLLVALPVLIHRVYLHATAFPEEIVLATGPEGGRYRDLCEQLAQQIEKDLGVEVTLRHTNGSLENLQLLQNEEDKVDLCLYQPGTGEECDGNDSVTFVANLYSQPAHLIVRRDSGILETDLKSTMQGKHIALGIKASGDYAMSLALLEHFDLELSSVNVRHADARSDDYYELVKQEFREGTLDAAIVTIGVQAPLFGELAGNENLRILSIPHFEAMVHGDLHVSPYTIAAGSYNFEPPVPRTDVQTVASPAQLLAHRSLPDNLVTALAQVAHGDEFLQKNHLWELADGGAEFSRRSPAFAVHPGAERFYDPRWRPLLDPDVVESTEGLRSFIISFVIAGFLLCRWMRDRKAAKSGHKLDRYIRAVMDIEQRQVTLDDDAKGNDVEELQKMLDEVTSLQQEGLRNFTAHELKADRGPQCFIEMCHALSAKINSKLSRQQTNRLIQELVRAIEGKSPGDETPGASP